ncbi:hypothetical protein OROHE_004606 [Orobanche hederae]
MAENSTPLHLAERTALGKIWFESSMNGSKLDALEREYFTRLIPCKANKTLPITDSGIGVTNAEIG